MTDGPSDDVERARADAPLSDLAERVGERREQAESGDAEGLFEEVSFESVGADSLWDDPDAPLEPTFGAVGDVVEAGEGAYVVSVRNFCERCRYFSAPPRARCTHDGTEIREFVDKDHVRVYDCPVVEERGLEQDRPLG